MPSFFYLSTQFYCIYILPNIYEILKKCFLDTTSKHIQAHTSMLPVAKWLIDILGNMEYLVKIGLKFGVKSQNEEEAFRSPMIIVN